MVASKAAFTNEILIPGTSTAALDPLQVRGIGLSGVVTILITLPYPVGTGLSGLPTNIVILRIRPAVPVVGSLLGIYEINGAFPE